ncbi:hypothetical protein ACFE04_030352 [Oxalis oulophora]
MARTLPTREYSLFGWSFSLNLGPFNMKEHAIITVFANTGVSYGGGDAYLIGAITVMKGYYKKGLSFLCAFFIIFTTQLIGYGWAGMLRRYLVDLVQMWWPVNVAQISLFRALHEKEDTNQGITRMIFFLIVLIGIFVYYVFPGYLFPILTFFSWVQNCSKWWFLSLLIGCMVVSLLMSFVWKDQIQLPWWGMLSAFVLAWIVTFPIGVIQATTNQQPGYDVITKFISGYALRGKPIANLLFNIYGRINTIHALSFLSYLKLGHYMKVPPRCMNIAQLVGTLVTEGLHQDSPWTCPKYRVTFDASVIWGLVGPRRLFGPGRLYRNLVSLFLIGAVLPVPIWVFSRMYSEKKWIPLINIHVISYGFAGMPPATPTNIASWIVTGTIFNFFVFRYHKRWWQRYNYIMSAALDTGTAFMGILLFFALQNNGVNLGWWGTKIDHYPLAQCPIAPYIVVKGCPVFN